MADFKNNEQAVFKKLQNLEKNKAKNINEAAEAAEGVRYWEDHLWELDKLQTVYNTDIATGLTLNQANAKN